MDTPPLPDLSDWPEDALRALAAVLPAAMAVRRADPGRRLRLAFCWDGEAGDLVVSAGEAA